MRPFINCSESLQTLQQQIFFLKMLATFVTSAVILFSKRIIIQVKIRTEEFYTKGETVKENEKKHEKYLA